MNVQVPVGVVDVVVQEHLIAGQTLKLSRCPHCSVHSPNLTKQHSINYTGLSYGRRMWHCYMCATCAGCILAETQPDTNNIVQYYPSTESVNDVLPDKVKAYLQQSIDSIFAPAGSVMLSACAVDAMLKDKGYTEGSLYKRIGEAVSNNILTPDMATWAHQVRLDANDQRHVEMVGFIGTQTCLT